MADSILILGSSSYLAHQTLADLRAQGRTVYTVSRQPQGDTTHHTVGNCFDESFLAQVVTQCQPQVILSFIGASTCEGTYADLVKLNCGVLYQLSRMSLKGVRVISLGSAAEYGASEVELLAEDQMVEPVSDYGHAKLAQTAFASGAIALSGADIFIVRVFNLIGARTPETPISEKIHQRVVALQDDEDLILDDPEMTRDFIDVADVSAGLIALLNSTATAGIYNLCSGRATSLRDLAAAFMQSHGKRGQIKMTEKPEFRSLVRRVVGSTEKLVAATGWSASRTLQQSADDQASIYTSSL